MTGNNANIVQSRVKAGARAYSISAHTRKRPHTQTPPSPKHAQARANTRHTCVHLIVGIDMFMSLHKALERHMWMPTHSKRPPHYLRRGNCDNSKACQKGGLQHAGEPPDKADPS